MFNGGWLIDDSLYLPHNPLLRDPARLWKIWFAPGSFIEYYPLEETVQWAQWRLWGNQTCGYHVTNVGLHIINALLVWRLLDKFGLKLAWLGGLIFIVHPAAVESVAWISELKNTLSLPPFLLAMCAWIDYEEQKRPRDYFLALGLFLAAMLCKISMATFPFVILLYAWWKRERIGWGEIRAAMPFFMVSLTLGVTTMMAGIWFTTNYHPGPDREAIVAGGVFSRMACAGLAFAFYFSKFFWPIRMMPLYPQWSFHSLSPWDFLPWPIFWAGTSWLWTKRKSWGRHALLGFGFFLILLAPFLGFTEITFMRFTRVMDHFLYLPMIGLIGLVVAVLGKIADQLPRTARPICAGLLTIMFGLLACESHGYTGIFVSQEKLWTYTLELNPDSDVAHNNLGLVYLNSGRLPQAIEQFEAALRAKPDYFFAHNGLGNALFLSGRAEEAIDHYQEALRLYPSYPEAHNGLANALLQSGHLAGARAECVKALKLNPNYVEAHCNLGLILDQEGHIPEAIEQFEIALSLHPTDARIQTILESLRARQQDAVKQK